MRRDEWKFNRKGGARRGCRSAAGAVWLLVAALALEPSTVVAQIPADAVFSGFERNGEFLFELDGKTLKDAEIYLSERAAAYLVLAPELASPLLISPRTQSIESVSFMKVAKRENGSIDLLADAAFDTLGTFAIDGQSIVFDVKGQKAVLAQKPPLLGEHEPAALRDYKPDYGRLAADYAPVARAIEILKAQTKDVRVLVYFGTWCSVCSRLVPRILRVDDELAGSKVHFEYYGLPQQLTSDPRARRDDVHGVPTAIIYADGKEVGRLSGADLNTPEKAFGRVLGEAKS